MNATSDPDTHAGPPRSRAATPPLHGRVLVVDDQPDTCEMFVESLKYHGCEVHSSTNAQRALELVDVAKPNVVITDLRLEGMSGIELCRRIAAHDASIPVIVITGHGSLDYAVAAIRAGAYDFITKPVEIDALVLAVHRALEHGALSRIVRAGIEQVRRSETSFRALIEQSPDLVAVVRDGALVYVNAALRRSLGVDDPSRLLGRLLVDVLHPDDRADATLPASTGGGSRNLRWLREDGSQVVTEAVAIDVTFDGSHAIAVIAHDLSESLLMQARLLQADRMASLGTLAAGAAHEINNPLTYVLLNADAAARTLAALSESIVLPSPPDAATVALRLDGAREALVRVTQGSERVRDIVSNLKTFARGEVDVRTAIDVRLVVASSIRMTNHEIASRARLIASFGDVHPVMANEGRLGQVIVNLLLNATQAIPPGAAEDHEIRVATGLDESGRVVIEVADTGVGVPAPLVGRIFDPFYTTKPVGLGTGLGLSICHGIITSIGGEITVQSREGEGTTFRIVLPAAPRVDADSPAPAAVAPPTARGSGGARKTALVIDDELAIGNAVKRALRDELEITVVTSAREALALLVGGARYDVILCDISMPVMTGIDVYDAVVRLDPGQAARTIFMTGGAFTGPGGEPGALPTVCIDKPLDLRRLRSEIARIGAASEGE